MLIRIEDAVKRFKNQSGLAKALGIPRQSITQQKGKSSYLTETWALKLHKLHPVITRELLAKAKDRQEVE